MAQKQIEKSFGDSEPMLKALAIAISQNNKGKQKTNTTAVNELLFLDAANRVYEIMRAFLLDKKNGGRPSNQHLLNIDKNSPEALFKFDYDFLSDRRLVLEYLETIDAKSAKKFSELTDELQNEVT